MGNRSRGGFGLLIAVAIALFSLFRYFGSSQVNEVTGEKQRVGNVTPEQEIALGLQAEPQITQQYGGESSDPRLRGIVESVGQRVVAQSEASKTPYRYEFHLLADDKTVNAFALPGGQIFITQALLRQLKSEAQVAGVLGHEVAHVVARHGAEHIAKQELTQGLTGAAVMATYDPNNPSSRGSAAVIAAVGQLVNLKYGREDELESDRLGVRFMSESGYDPRAMIRVMEVLKAAGGGGRQPEFFASHPNPENRIGKIKEAIAKEFPDGVPGNLQP
ncbi:MAG: M48 family metalloprotease [Armatimonadetes bacterium]|nr:M48 family metalloprotease [Armatimonadota bacterium]